LSQSGIPVGFSSRKDLIRSRFRYIKHRNLILDESFGAAHWRGRRAAAMQGCPIALMKQRRVLCKASPKGKYRTLFPISTASKAWPWLYSRFGIRPRYGYGALKSSDGTGDIHSVSTCRARCRYCFITSGRSSLGAGHFDSDGQGNVVLCYPICMGFLVLLTLTQGK